MTTPETPPTSASPKSNSKPNIFRRAYDWVLGWSKSPWGTWALFVLAFIESSFFLIPPDILLIALATGKPKRSFWYATVCTAGSVTGAWLGYLIGYQFYQLLAQPIVDFYHLEELIQQVIKTYQDNAFAAIMVAGFSPIPYKAFTIAAGVAEISLITLTISSVLARGSRFFLVAGICYFLGPKAQDFIDQHFNKLVWAFTIILILGFVLLKFLPSS